MIVLRSDSQNRENRVKYGGNTPYRVTNRRIKE